MKIFHMCKCRYCNKKCKNNNSLRNHERLCKSNSNRQVLVSNFIVWNEKRRNEHIKGENQYTKAERLGLDKPVISEETRDKIRVKAKGRQHSEETKKKISVSQSENMKGKCQNWLNNKKSYAEEYFDKVFIDAEHQYRISKYVLDYAWPDSKTYIEVDGEQHYTVEGLEHDKKRTDFLETLGWKCKIRIRWSEYKKLSFEEKQMFLLNLLGYIPSVL